MLRFLYVHWISHSKIQKHLQFYCHHQNVTRILRTSSKRLITSLRLMKYLQRKNKVNAFAKVFKKFPLWVFEYLYSLLAVLEMSRSPYTVTKIRYFHLSVGTIFWLTDPTFSEYLDFYDKHIFTSITLNR